MNLTHAEQEEYLNSEYPEGNHQITRVFRCDKCNRIIERWRGEDDLQCACGAWYNTFGQRLRDDWQGNPSNYDSDIGDMEGFEIQQLRQEQGEY